RPTNSRTVPSSPPFPSATLFRSGGLLRDRRIADISHPGAEQAQHHRNRGRELHPQRHFMQRVDQRLVVSDRTIPEGRVINERFRSEEHTSELQSRENLVCRLLLE